MKQHAACLAANGTKTLQGELRCQRVLIDAIRRQSFCINSDGYLFGLSSEDLYASHCRHCSQSVGELARIIF